MKLYQLQLGRTKVPYGQFYGGLAGWEGLGALFRFITDKRHFIWVPINAYLLEHPREGLILIDAGICPDQAHRRRRECADSFGNTWLPFRWRRNFSCQIMKIDNLLNLLTPSG